MRARPRGLRYDPERSRELPKVRIESFNDFRPPQPLSGFRTEPNGSCWRVFDWPNRLFARLVSCLPKD